MNATTIAVVSAFGLMALAGCTGSFDIDQTEPFRVQLDGAPQTVVVREGAAPREGANPGATGSATSDNASAPREEHHDPAPVQTGQTSQLPFNAERPPSSEPGSPPPAKQVLWSSGPSDSFSRGPGRDD